MYGMGGLCAAGDVDGGWHVGVTLGVCGEKCLAASVCVGFNYNPSEKTCALKTGGLNFNFSLSFIIISIVILKKKSTLQLLAGLNLDACDQPFPVWDMYKICKLKYYNIKAYFLTAWPILMSSE